MVRTQVQLSEEQWTKIHDVAKVKGLSFSEVVRQGMDVYLRTAPAAMPKVSREELVRRSLAVAGKFASGTGDLAENHDKYFVESIEATEE